MRTIHFPNGSGTWFLLCRNGAEIFPTRPQAAALGAQARQVYEVDTPASKLEGSANAPELPTIPPNRALETAEPAESRHPLHSSRLVLPLMTQSPSLVGSVSM
jgi:hypothetical protein